MKLRFKLIVGLLIVAFIASSCAPQIYGQRKHRKQKNCGCELVKPLNNIENRDA